MYRCGNCCWFVGKKKNPAHGRCIVTDTDKMFTDKRCATFEKVSYNRL